MDSKINKLIDYTKDKFGLENYYLKRYNLDRNVNIFNETIYTLCMEWFPNHITEHIDDDLNPEGTAVIDINVHSKKIESVVFVGGKSYANGITFPNLNTGDIIKWIEQETELTHKKQFQLYKEETGGLYFQECIDGVPVSSSGPFEIHFDKEGKLTMFSVHGQFPTEKLIKKETYSLSLEAINQISKEQLQLIEFPSDKQQLLPVYAVEEIYIANDQSSTISIEFLEDDRPYFAMDQTIYWDESIDKLFEREEIDLIEDITVEQAFSNEPSPDTYPITKIEREKCVVSVNDFLRRVYPNDSGKWILKTIHRDSGYIFATLRLKKKEKRALQRKIIVMIDPESFEAVNYVDNQPIVEMFDHFQAPEKVTVTKEAAYEKLKDFFELKPYYVYDFKQKQYILCGKLECQYGVDASNGEIIELNDL